MSIQRKPQFFLLCLLAGVLTTGCRALVAKSGEAKIYTCWELMREGGRALYYIKLPPIGLSQKGTHTLRVRNLPAYLAGQFTYSLSIQAPSVDLVSEPTWGYATSETWVPWKDAVITLTFRKMDGSDAYRQTVPLGTSPHGLPTRESRHIEWTLVDGNPASVPDTSYDIVIVVERPSLRQSDRLSLQSYAHLNKP